jgi:serine/threonine-protein kinase
LSAGDSQRFGKYSVLYRLGVGGMAEVFKCRQSGIGGFNKLVVVKRIRPELAGDESFVNMFLDEARIAANLAHPNVVQVFEIDQVGELPYIAMEYVRGPTLALINREERKRKQPRNACIARIMAGICAALHCAHHAKDEHGTPLDIIHRDVSPQNIIVSMEGMPKLLDFGIAKARGQLAHTNAGALKGKLKYMAPEQIASGGAVTPAVDVFAAGVCLFEASTLTLPFVGESELGVMRSVASGKFPRPSELSPNFDPRLEELILWAMDPDPSRRCPDARALQQALEAYADREGCTQADLVHYLEELFPKAAAQTPLPSAYVDVESRDIIGPAEPSVQASPFSSLPPARCTVAMRSDTNDWPRRIAALDAEQHPGAPSPPPSRPVPRRARTLAEAVIPELDVEIEEQGSRESRAPMWGAALSVAAIALFALAVLVTRSKGPTAQLGAPVATIADGGASPLATAEARRAERLLASAHEALKEGRYIEASELARRLLSERLDEPRATALLLEATSRERERSAVAMLQAAEHARAPAPTSDVQRERAVAAAPPGPAPAPRPSPREHTAKPGEVPKTTSLIDAAFAEQPRPPAPRPGAVAEPPPFQLALSAKPAPAAAPSAAAPSIECPDGARMIVQATQHEVWCEEGGEREGPYVRLFPNGTKAVEGEYRHGKKHGRWIEYYEQGGERSRVDWRRGVEVW